MGSENRADHACALVSSWLWEGCAVVLEDIGEDRFSGSSGHPEIRVPRMQDTQILSSPAAPPVSAACGDPTGHRGTGSALASGASPTEVSSCHGECRPRPTTAGMVHRDTPPAMQQDATSPGPGTDLPEHRCREHLPPRSTESDPTTNIRVFTAFSGETRRQVSGTARKCSRNVTVTTKLSSHRCILQVTNTLCFTPVNRREVALGQGMAHANVQTRLVRRHCVRRLLSLK